MSLKNQGLSQLCRVVTLDHKSLFLEAYNNVNGAAVYIEQTAQLQTVANAHGNLINSSLFLMLTSLPSSSFSFGVCFLGQRSPFPPNSNNNNNSLKRQVHKLPYSKSNNKGS